jgi:hypothetical protein
MSDPIQTAAGQPNSTKQTTQTALFPPPSSASDLSPGPSFARGASLDMGILLQRSVSQYRGHITKEASRRRAWIAVNIRELRRSREKKTLVARIARNLKRSEGATRQKAFSIGLSLDSRV